MAKDNDDNKDNDSKMSAAEAGKLGGEETKKRGSEFYSQIGSEQGKENNPGNFDNRSTADVKEAGHRGGTRQGQNDSDQQDEAA